MKIEKININKIIPYANNAKLHPDWQVKQIKESIEQFGNNDPIAIDENNVVIEGHGRLLALKELGYHEAEIIRLTHLSDEEKRAYILAHNKLTMNTNFDIELLEQELFSIEDIDMEEFGFDLSDEYDNFIEKFEPKRTTDDCYTPQNIYDAIKDYVIEKYNLTGRKVIRPFYPGGDYQNFTYPEDCIVIDNPPFSILAEIVKWYNENKIDYFLFSPYLVNLNTQETNHVVAKGSITYENGADVATAFLTNLGEWFIESDPKLQKIIDEENQKNLKKDKIKIPNYEYPDEVITSAIIGQLSQYGIEFKLKKEDCYFIRELEHQKEHSKTVFGGGYLISKEKAEAVAKVKKLAKDEIFRWELSDNEKAIIERLGSNASE